MRVALDALGVKLSTVASQEVDDKNGRYYRSIAAKRDGICKEIREGYQSHADAIAQIMSLMIETDAAIESANRDRPPGTESIAGIHTDLFGGQPAGHHVSQSLRLPVLGQRWPYETIGPVD